ncbi:MAG: hypothetical protein WCV00_10790 [Verrucomicrobiia bacterium]
MKDFISFLCTAIHQVLLSLSDDTRVNSDGKIMWGKIIPTFPILRDHDFALHDFAILRCGLTAL